MTAPVDVFRTDYADALRRHLSAPDQTSLSVGHELGRRALVQGISLLDITENHFRVSGDGAGLPAALEFLLQTLAALDIATRGFLDGTRRYEQARTTSLTLQRAMLGAISLPPRFAVRYEPAVPPLEIGGDWYDVVPLPDRRIGVVVGDCVGRGLEAAAVMGQLRSSARALLLTGSGPGRMLDQLDVVAAQLPGAGCTTVFAAVLDPLRGVLQYSSAGHLPGLVAESGGDVSQLDTQGLPLATFDTGPRSQGVLMMPPGATLMVYTDGLVERRRTSIDVGLDIVADLLASAGALTPDEVAERVLGARRPVEGYDDDVALVVYRQAPGPLRVEIAADAANLATMRASVQVWLAEAGVPEELASDLVLAANEACTNSIEHGHRHDPTGRVIVTAAVDAHEVTVTVVDDGHWQMPGPDPGHRGRGIVMMRALVDEVDIDPTDSGTVVRMRADLMAAREGTWHSRDHAP